MAKIPSLFVCLPWARRLALRSVYPLVTNEGKSIPEEI